MKDNVGIPPAAPHSELSVAFPHCHKTRDLLNTHLLQQEAILNGSAEAKPALPSAGSGIFSELIQCPPTQRGERVLSLRKHALYTSIS